MQLSKIKEIRKIKAFTLQEMMVVLVVSSIVISIAMAVLNLFQKQLLSIQKRFANNTEIRLFERTFNNDFQLLNSNFNEKTNELICNSEIEKIIYTFKPNYVLRNSDTIRVKVQTKKVFLDNILVQSGIIDAIDFTFESTKIFLYKTKDATFYMNQVWLSK